MTVFVGIDLAWSGRKPTGICVLEDDGGRLRSRCVGTVCWHPEQVFAWMQTLGPDVLAAVDAPLIIGDHRGAEAVMARAFPGTGLRAYSARWDFLARHGITAGPELGALLAASGWNLDPGDLARPARQAVEVFPHAVIVGLFENPAMLRYKKGRMAARLAAMASFQALLERHASTCLDPSAGCAVAQCVRREAALLRGTALKSHEDELDAIACALAAHHFATSGPQGIRVFGDAADGYIAVPVPVPACATLQS